MTLTISAPDGTVLGHAVRDGGGTAILAGATGPAAALLAMFAAGPRARAGRGC